MSAADDDLDRRIRCITEDAVAKIGREVAKRLLPGIASVGTLEETMDLIVKGDRANEPGRRG